MSEFIGYIFGGFIFISIGIWAFLRKSPMHFWTGSTVMPEVLKDVKAYNRANGIMWCTIGVVHIIWSLTLYSDLHYFLEQDFYFLSMIYNNMIIIELIILFPAYQIIYRRHSIYSKSKK